MVLINSLAGRARQNHLMYRLSSHHCTCQSCKKSARIKLWLTIHMGTRPVDHWNKLHHQSCSRQKNDQNGKKDGWRHGCYCHKDLENCQCSSHHKGSGSVPANFQAEKVQIVVPGWFSMTGWQPSLQWRHPGDPPVFLFAKYLHIRLFSVLGRWRWCWRTSRCPRVASWWTERGHLNHPKKWVRCRLSVVDGPLQKVHRNQPWLGLKKFWNKRVFT